MTHSEKLGTGVYISVQEAVPVLLVVLCSFLKTLAVFALDAGACVLFLTARLEYYLPQTFIATAVLIFLIWPVLSILKERTIQGPSGVMFAAAVISIGIYAVLFFTATPWADAAAMVWKEGFRVLAETAFWVAAFRFGIFNGHPKTLFAVLLAQGVAVLCAAGLIRSYAFFPETLVLWAAIFSFAAAITLRILITNKSAPIAERFVFTKQKLKHSGTDSQQRKLYIYFFALSGLLSFSAGIFDYYFLGSVTDFAETGSRMADVFSSVFALLAVLIFVFLYLSKKGKGNIFSILYLIPVALLTAVAGGWFGIFGLIASAKAVFNLTTIQPKESTLQTIPLIVSLRTGFRATMLRKSVIEPAALAAAGVFLLMIENIMTEQDLLYFMAGLAVVIFICILMIRKTYVRMTLNMLKHHLWRGGRLLLMGNRMKAQLNRSLHGTDADEAMYALRVLEESMTPSFFNRLKQALHHPDEEVRLYALKKIESLELFAAETEVSKCFEKDTSLRVRRMALRVMCRLGNTQTREKAITLIGDTDIREGALTGLLAVGREGVFSAIENIAALAASLHPENRCLAAVVLGEAGNQAFYHPLITLLNDEEPEVCRAALAAAGKLVNPRLLPAVMETFRFPELREDAVAVLLQYREKAFPEIEKILVSEDYPVQFRMLLARVLGRIASPSAEKFLFKHIGIADRRVRFNIVKSLVLTGYKASGKNVNKVRLCLYDEIEEATGILAALETFEDDKNPDRAQALSVLQSALQGDLRYIKERILLLLALLQPSGAVTEFLNRYASAADEEQETSKIVDKILSGELRTLCLPLFEKKTIQQQLALLRPHFYPPVLSVEGYVRQILQSPYGELTDWTRACAAYVSGFIKDISTVDDLVKLLSDPDPIVRETAVWALGKILPREEASRLIFNNLIDPAAPVARLARFITDGTGQTVF